MNKSIEELLNSAKEALDKRDYEKALTDYKCAADMGSSIALVCLGDI